MKKFLTLIPIILIIFFFPLMGKAEEIFYPCLPEELDSGPILQGILSSFQSNISAVDLSFNLIASSTLESGVCLGSISATVRPLDGSVIWIVIAIIVIWIFEHIFREIRIRLRR